MYKEQLKISSYQSEVLFKGKKASKWNIHKHKCAVTDTVPETLLERWSRLSVQ